MRCNGYIAFLLATLVLILAYLLLWPVPIDPGAWTPPKAPELTGVYEPNNRLAKVERLGTDEVTAAEDVAVDSQGHIYGGMKDGRIVRFQPDGSAPDTITNTGGRPLGLHFDAAGNLIVADSHQGLLSMAPNGYITVLSTEANGIPFRLTDDLDIAANGIIYFSDASSKFPLEKFMYDILEHRPNGRLLAYDPGTKTTTLLLDKIFFANGVAVSPDQSFVLVVETGKYRVRRYWIAGPKQGQSDIFIDNLPGMPDGISSNGKGTFWLAIPTLRNALLDKVLPKPSKRKIIVRLPDALSPQPVKYGFILGLDEQGRVVHNLQDPAGAYAMITSVQQHEDMLYLGSLEEDAIGRIPAP